MPSIFIGKGVWAFGQFPSSFGWFPAAVSVLLFVVPIKKQQIRKQIVASLSESLETMMKAARTAHAEATHESSKAENKYDTRGLEAAYLAGGQARQAREVAEAIEAFQAMDLHDFKPVEPIGMGALVELESDRDRSLFFIGPKSGGLEITVQKQEITVITPQSPLGQNLEGRKAGDRWKGKAGLTASFHIVSVR